MALRRASIPSEKTMSSKASFASRLKSPAPSSLTASGADAHSATLNRRFVVKAAAAESLLAEIELDDDQVPEPSAEAIQAVLRGLGR
jgi:hypothetical protein